MPGPVAEPRADAVRARFRSIFGGDDLPVPVDAIAEDLLGLSVGEAGELPCSGLLLPDRREIWLNGREADEAPGRRRFTLAHELGHWVCQVLEGHRAPAYCRSDEVGVGEGRALEREANVFAAELLMPRELVRTEHASAGGLRRMASAFGVSEEAMHWRLYNAGLVGEPPHAVRR